jgi:hypothetical protein
LIGGKLMSCDCEYDQDANPIEGWYANYFQIGHNAFEFLLDFGQSYLEAEPVWFHTRIVTSPTYAKTLLMTLRASIDRYEQSFGTISEVAEYEPSRSQAGSDDE